MSELELISQVRSIFAVHNTDAQHVTELANILAVNSPEVHEVYCTHLKPTCQREWSSSELLPTQLNELLSRRCPGARRSYQYLPSDNPVHKLWTLNNTTMAPLAVTTSNNDKGNRTLKEPKSKTEVSSNWRGSPAGRSKVFAHATARQSCIVWICCVILLVAYAFPFDSYSERYCRMPPLPIQATELFLHMRSMRSNSPNQFEALSGSKFFQCFGEHIQEWINNPEARVDGRKEGDEVGVTWKETEKE